MLIFQNFLRNAVLGLQWQKGFTNMPQAITLAKKMFDEGGRKDAKRKLLLITDGTVGAKWVTLQQSEKLRSQSVEVSAMVIRERNDDHVAFMREVVSLPKSSNLRCQNLQMNEF